MKTSSKVWGLAIVLWLGLISSGNAATADPRVLHILNRLSFGATPGEVERVEKMGIDRYIQEQLTPDRIPEPQTLTDSLAQLKTLNLLPIELAQEYRPMQKKLDPADRQAARQKARQVRQEAIQARLLRSTTSPRQLQEVMVDFWYNHFNVYAKKGLDRFWVGAYEQSAIRPHVLGRFRELLGATARHPAMLFYLDNWQNTAPKSPGARGRFQGLNENYARELMELHTLGVEGGYTQQDVIALAKILTGWGFRRSAQGASDPNGFYFDPKRHDSSDKVFLGHAIKGGGIEEGEQALDLLAKSPATARQISFELAQYFVADQPPRALVDRLTQRYLATDGDIRSMLDTLFHSPEFWNPRTFNAKFKTPYQYVISAIRATGTEVQNVKPIDRALQQLGMPLYECLTPDGYQNTESAWLNPDAMTRRISFATDLANGKVPIGDRPSPLNAVQLTATLGDRFSANTQTAIASSPDRLRAALILGSPEFMYR
ncbi:DUF1800 domain-containing protein [Phormidesmis priestleyi]